MSPPCGCSSMARAPAFQAGYAVSITVTRSTGRAFRVQRSAHPGTLRSVQIIPQQVMRGLHLRYQRTVLPRRIATETFDSFRAKEGSREVASRFALTGLTRELLRTVPTAVLEFGPGIGTTTAATVTTLGASRKSASFLLDAIEPNAYCREQLARNVVADQVSVVTDFDHLVDATRRYDFVIVDGPDDARFVDRLERRAVVYVENNRADQREQLLSLTSRPVAAVSRWPLLTLSRRGGFHVFQFEPTATERLRFEVRNRVEHGVAAVRPIARRTLRTLGLGQILIWSDRRGANAGAQLDTPRIDDEQ